MTNHKEKSHFSLAVVSFYLLAIVTVNLIEAAFNLFVQLLVEKNFFFC